MNTLYSRANLTESAEGYQGIFSPFCYRYKVSLVLLRLPVYLPVHLSHSVYQLGSRWTDFHKPLFVKLIKICWENSRFAKYRTKIADYLCEDQRNFAFLVSIS